VPLPAACADREIALEDGETLVEHTVFFHGTSQSGDVDGAQDLADGGASRLFMDADAPTGAQDKVLASRPATVGNPNVSQNPFLGYWIGFLDEEVRVVCAQARIFAGTTTGKLPVQFWVDSSFVGEGPPAATATGQAAPNQVSEYVVNFGALDVEAFDNLLIQIDAPAPGGLVYYDSTGTYVTVEVTQ
jgi:hypothetical protein